MIHSQIVRRRKTLFAAFAGVTLAISLADCDSSIIKSTDKADWLVTNGIAFDRAAIDIPKDIQTLVLPDNAKVVQGGNERIVSIFLKKTLNFGGHPVVPISIGSQRMKMGCTQFRAGSQLTLATFGEWDTHMEGGTFIKMIVVVPQGLQLVTRPGLSGDKTEAENHSPKDSYWEPGPLNSGWTTVRTQADPQQGSGQF